jgi:hypothetical protein
MFTIELLAGNDREHPDIIERTTSPRYLIYDAEHRARTLLADARKRFPVDPPRGYRVLNQHGAVVATFWRDASGPTG